MSFKQAGYPDSFSEQPAAAWVPLSSQHPSPGSSPRAGLEAAGSMLPRNSTELPPLQEKERSPLRFLNCKCFQVFRSVIFKGLFPTWSNSLPGVEEGCLKSHILDTPSQVCQVLQVHSKWPFSFLLQLCDMSRFSALWSPLAASVSPGAAVGSGEGGRPKCHRALPRSVELPLAVGLCKLGDTDILSFLFHFFQISG